MSSQQSTDDCILVDTSSLALQLLEESQESQESPFDESLIDPALLPTTVLFGTQYHGLITRSFHF